MQDIPTTTQLPPATISEVIGTWIADAERVHKRLLQVLQDPRVRTSMPPMMRDLLDEAVDQLRNCRVHAPTPALVHGWARSMDADAVEAMALGAFD
jgi:hypothetical protein